MLYGKFGAYFIVVKQDSVFLFVVKKKESKKKKMSPYASSYARVAYNSVSGAFVRFYANENKMVVLVWKYVLWLTLQTERMRNSKGSQPMSTSLS